MKRALVVFAATLAAILAALAMLAGCSSETPAPKSAGSASSSAPPAPQLETAFKAFNTLYVTSRNWSTDSKPFRLESSATSEANGQGGKVGVWRASFGSASKQRMEAFIWSGIGPKSGRGVDHSTEDPYNPNNRSTMAFETAYWKIDSDKAFETAQKHGGEKLLKEHPNTQVTFVLDYSSVKNIPVWHVTYSPEGRPALTVDINATDGEFIRAEK